MGAVGSADASDERGVDGRVGGLRRWGVGKNVWMAEFCVRK